MKSFPSILVLSLSVYLSSAAQSSFAQTQRATPRQAFTAFATDTPLVELKFKPISMQPLSPEPAPIKPAAPEILEPVPETASVPKLEQEPRPELVVVVADPELPAQILPAERPVAETEDPETSDVPGGDIDMVGGPAKSESAAASFPEIPVASAAPAEDPKAPAGLGEDKVDEKSASLPEPKTSSLPEPEILTPDVPTPVTPTPDKPTSDRPGSKISAKEVTVKEASLPPKMRTTSPAPAAAKKKSFNLPDLAGPPAANKSLEKYENILPFYTSAKDYLSARGNEKQTQLRLTYEVSARGAASVLAAPAKTKVITLGADFAATESDKKIRIFDFKTNRILTMPANGKNRTFDSVSLFAGALKNVNSVNRTTKNGSVSQINIGPDVVLDAFWLEASLGWAARGKFDGLVVTADDGEISSSYKNVKPFSASLTGPKMPSEKHMRTLFGWWNHDLAIHPAILPEIGRPENAPKSMVIRAHSPKFPDGLITQWTLKDSKTFEAKFPLPSDAKTSLEAGKSSPLAFAISKAASGEALKQRPSLNDLRQEIHDKRNAGNDFEAWLTAQMLAHRIGGCEQDPALLCEDIVDLEKGAKAGSDLAKLPAIIRKAKQARTRIEGFTELAPYVEGEIAPAFLVKIAGETRARIKTADLPTDKLKALTAKKLLEEALVKNPYDPVIYRTLGQVYAAQGKLADSWDMQDAMRRLPDINDTLSDPINWAESSLLARAPGFFLDGLP